MIGGYNQSSGTRDSRAGMGVGSLKPSPAGLSVGDQRIINVKMNNPEEDLDDLSDIDDEEIEDIQDLLSRSRKLAPPTGRSDSVGGRTDNVKFGYPGVLSELPDHTNTASKGMVTGLTFRKPSGGKNKGSSLTGRAGSYPMINPGNYRRTGTLKGTSKKHDDLSDPAHMYSEEDILDPAIQAFDKHQRIMKKIRKVIESLEKH